MEVVANSCQVEGSRAAFGLEGIDALMEEYSQGSCSGQSLHALEDH